MALVGSKSYNIKLVITQENRKQVVQHINFKIEISLGQEKILYYYNLAASHGETAKNEKL
jgi:hypothetical protein